MEFKWNILFTVTIIVIIPVLITGLEVNEGEPVTLTCPKPSRRLPIVWQGPQGFQQYTRGLTVSLDLSADQRSRISLSGDHANGYYNLHIESIRKSDSGKYRCKTGSRVIRGINVKVKTQAEQNQGLFPYILNLATRARITANATCGEDRAEYFCKLVEHVDLMPQISHCDYCNAHAGAGRLEEIGAAHPIGNAIDGSNRWWQSPSISNGWEYNYVTITLDLGLIYQVAYVIVKAANAPRPGNWILEKSLDGVYYRPWQYFATTDDDCARIYNVPTVEGKPSYDYLRDDEVRCTSYFSKLNPVENGEIFISLTNGRPGIFVPSKTLLDFTSARYVRLRFQKIRTLNADLMSLQSRDPRNLDPSVTRRYFYSVKDISIGGQCICYGHASECQRQGDSDRLACVCQHNTCGSNCEICCPLFNQKPWVRGGGNGVNGQINLNVECEACNCHGHADSCVYNATVAELGLSLNMNGERKGGGVCIDCTDFTTGINCEKCLPGYYRPRGVSQNANRPCRQCNCQESVGSTGICVVDDSMADEGLMPGSCICKEGFAGQNCDQCAPGYHSFPYCEPCSCSIAGTVDPNMCEGRCVCKENVDGVNCDSCKSGYYDLSKDNELGCRQCFCFGISTVCQSAGLGLVQISDMRADMDGWTIITLNDEDFTYFPTMAEGWLEYRTFPAREQNFVDTGDRSVRDEVIYYWQAPVKYYGNRLTSYGGELHYTMMFTLDESAPWQYHLAEADVILQGGNITVTNGRNYIRENQENKRSITLDETQWFKLDTSSGRTISADHVSRKEFMLMLYDLRRILIRATHHTAQDYVMLKDVLLDTSSAGSTSDISISGVEKCSCPRGYTGLSCESCDIGWRRVDNVLYGGQCVPCACYGHSKTCDPYTGRCLMCTDNTEGEHCDVCRTGYYGDPTRGTPDDCKPCACPLIEPSNNFATTCVLNPKFNDPDAFMCLDCAPGYTGERCERCDHGYFGYPGLLGNLCERCECNGNIDSSMVGSCDQLTGECRLCLHNTEGPDCGRCRLGYYGTAMNGDCKLCTCDPFGSSNMTCNRDTGNCECKPHYTGRQCDRCEAGYGDIMSGCKECNCSRVGSLDYRCHPVTGQCVCRPGVSGRSCDRCQEGYYGYSVGGCYDCRCYSKGSNDSEICDVQTGRCNCLPFVKEPYCDTCQENYWGLESGQGCTPCDCDPQGSYFAQCDSLTGQCRCKRGVAGLHCDECVEGYYGLISKGECLPCEPCDLPGHICHPDTGECVCPPNTEGERCEQCIDTYWGYDPRRGCKSCDCDPIGAFDNNCDPLSGQCACKLDYNGTHCDSCLFGFFNFPDCNLCLCSVEGTEPRSCNSQGACRCAEPDGQCECKANTMGRTCTKCVENSFSLDIGNPDGCTDCFCFGRTDSCGQAQYVWTKSSVTDMTVSFSSRANTMVARQQNGFYVIPANVSWTGSQVNTQGEPMYWRLPNVTGDRTLSYNGYLTFTVEHGSIGTELSDLEGLRSKPLVVLSGYGIPLMYRSDVRWQPDKDQKFKVRLHEHYWRTQRNGDVSRERMMVILQNVTDILVRATWDNTAISAKIRNIEYDVAVDNDLLLGPPALGIEQCNCPPQYSGLSCQNPADGYYRVPHIGPIDIKVLVDIIGEVKPCKCNGHGDSCDPETGICYNCRHNTKGNKCEQCADGFYGDPTTGSPTACQRCACPLEVQSNNFSPTCERIDNDLICTACQTGYTGDRCEYCAEGYYGDPSTPGDTCRPCNCNPEGSVLAQCDYRGICQCLPGIKGDKCDQCQPRYAVVKGSCISCDEGCTRELMSDMDELDNMISTLPFDPSNVNISAPYRKLNFIRNETRILSDKLQKLRYAEVNNIRDQVDDLETEVDRIEDRSEGTLKKSKQNKRDSRKLLRSANEIEDTIDLLRMNVDDLVEDLEETVASSFHNRSGINVTSALAEARKILDEIKRRDFSDEMTAARNEHDLAEKLSDRVKAVAMRLTNTSEVEEKINNMQDALDDLLDHVEDSVKNSEETMKKLGGLRSSIRNIKRLVSESKKMNKDLGIDGTDQLLTDAKEALNRTNENIRTLETRASTLDAAIVPLEEKVDKLKDNLPGKDVLVEQAWTHANNLSKYAQDLEKMFESTRNAAAEPLKAARVFDNIVKAIEEATAAARKAIRDVENATGMKDLEKLKNSVAEALRTSKELLDQANTTMNTGVKDLDKALYDVNSRLNYIDERQLDSSDKHTEINDEIDKLPRNFVDRIAEVQNSLDDTERVADRVNDRTSDMVDKVNNEMMPKLRELQNIVGDKFEDIYVSLTGTKTDLSDMRNLTDSIDTRIGQSRKLRSDLRDKLSRLKQSIREAREEANKVKTSLKAKGQCVKKFRPMAKPGTINSISFAFKTSDPEKNMLFILIQNPEINTVDEDKYKEYLAVELRNRKIRFSWNAGGGSGSVDSDIVIESQTDVIKETDKWYQVKAERTGRLGRLLVHKLSEEAGSPRTSSSPVGSSVMGLGEKTDVFISGVPESYPVPDGLTSDNFTGCMGSMYVDDQLVGLYNFETNIQDTCKACLEVPSQAPGANVYSFDGTGYAVTDKNRIQSPLLANIILDFKTYWDNASLFFVGNEETGEYMSLELRNGKVVFNFYLGEGTYGTLETESRYNTKNWVSVAAARSGLLALLEVGGENKLIEAPAGDYLLDDVEKSDLFYGGMPPSVNMNKYSEASGKPIITDRFLGCMKGLQISVDSVNLWDGKSTVGVTEGCKNSGLRSIGFYGSGFAEYPGVSLDSKDGDLSVSFSTEEPDALLLLAKNINADQFYYLSLTGGRVEGRFSGGGSTVIVKSDKTYNDGKLHNIAVKKTDRRIELYVDDKSIGKGRLENRFDKITVREDGGLYLGGLPVNFDTSVGNKAVVSKTLDGCLSDVVINGNVLNINDPKQYHMADIGRCRKRDKSVEGFNTNPPPVVSDSPAPAEIRLPEEEIEIPPVKTTDPPKPKTTEKMVSDEAPTVPTTPGPTACAANTGIFDYETDAFSFGEEQTSLSQINVTKKEVQRKFSISFEFRTFYKDGLLLYLSNLDHTAFLATQIKDGDIVVSFDRKGTIKEMVVDTKASLNDGKWHTVVVSKVKQRITVTVDDKSKKGAKISKVLKVDVPLFVGGVPNTFVPLMNDKVIQHSTRGCIRNFFMNSILKTFDDVTLVRGVDKCFTKVEKGAHFTGDSYGVFDNKFEVGGKFMTEFEFRTSKPEGILATVSNPDGGEALTLQLHQGQVKLNVINSGGQVMTATSYSSAFNLCDNEWHKIRASLKRNNVTVEVDDRVSFSDSGSDDIVVTATSAPLYLGGKPESSNQAAALTNLGFEGCLRNVIVQNKQVDWFKLSRSVAIHKTSCPVS
ncbi:laminin subunit alpha-2-like isoform X2 [Mercenaria mercenaria]|uniref:laminin subunit alpha-2-like isoform X2 n=1 Tax=Mercenaria mercenaria TaxID=6596 RepID=UPI00234F89C0|nr:laminin subunit alpha-2-like isoform X2 [Mercenaria mercenaria]